MFRKELSKVVGFITELWSFYGHLYRMDIHINTLEFRKCGEIVETARRVLLDCLALYLSRSRILEVCEEEVGRQDDIV